MRSALWKEGLFLAVWEPSKDLHWQDMYTCLLFGSSEVCGLSRHRISTVKYSGDDRRPLTGTAYLIELLADILTYNLLLHVG